jgi:hypothetical protein
MEDFVWVSITGNSAELLLRKNLRNEAVSKSKLLNKIEFICQVFSPQDLQSQSFFQKENQ